MANKLKIRKGDRVKVIAGRSRGKVGDVLRVLPAEKRVVVSGVNVIKRHTKPNMANPHGGVIAKEAAIHISNVALFNTATGKADRVGVKLVDGKRVRVYKSSGEVVKA